MCSAGLQTGCSVGVHAHTYLIGMTLAMLWGLMIGH
jgi:hypothetical protein